VRAFFNLCTRFHLACCRSVNACVLSDNPGSLFCCSDCSQAGPWIIAFAFGLFHGLGFAGALSEIGGPQHEVLLALLMFNVGVETGQLLFIAVVVSLMALLRRLLLHAPQGAWRVLPYSIGCVAAFWTIQRVGSFI